MQKEDLVLASFAPADRKNLTLLILNSSVK